MSLKITSLMTAAVFFVGMGGISMAQAGEAMPLSVAQMDTVTAGGSWKDDHKNGHNNGKKDRKDWFKHYRNKDAAKASATADAACYGSPKCATSTETFAVVDDNFAASYSASYASQKGLH